VFGAFLDAVQVFWHHLSAVRWGPLGIALLLNFLRIAVRSLAWRNILTAAYPEAQIKRATIFGAYFVGVGVNSIAPARAGDVVKLYLVRHRVPGSSYATLAPTLVVETLFDFVAAGAIFLWALSAGVVPSAQVIKRLPSVDLAWPLRHPNIAIIVAAVIVLGLLLFGMAAGHRVEAFRQKFARGFAILSDLGAYLRLVVSWQALSWVFRLGAIYYFLQAFRLTPSLHNALVVQTVESLATLLPFTPGGAGTKQGLTAYALRHEFSVSSVISFSVGMNIASVVANVVIGFAALFLMARTLRWRKLADAQKQEESEGATTLAR
jgi:uncharacterized membrane protein YbhN (UPF0104 family)